jgi:hypothetical protein
MTKIAADGTSSNDNSRDYTVTRTETVSPEGIIVIHFTVTPKETETETEKPSEKE